MSFNNLIEYYPEKRPNGSIREYERKYTTEMKKYIKAFYHGVSKIFPLSNFTREEAIKEARNWLEVHIDDINKNELLVLKGQNNKYLSSVYKDFDEMEKDINKDIVIDRFNFNKAFDNDKNYTMAIIGSSQSGKTTFLDFLINKVHGLYDLIILFSQNKDAKVYDDIKKLKNVMAFEEFEEDLIKDLHRLNMKTENYLKFLIIFDDELDNKYNPMIRKLFSTYRNANISSLFSAQDVTFITPSNRNQMSYIFLFKQNNGMGIQKVVDNFLMGGVNEQFFGDKDIKMKKSEKENILINFFKKATEDHNFLVIDVLDKYKLFNYKVNFNN